MELEEILWILLSAKAHWVIFGVSCSNLDKLHAEVLREYVEYILYVKKLLKMDAMWNLKISNLNSVGNTEDTNNQHSNRNSAELSAGSLGNSVDVVHY